MVILCPGNRHPRIAEVLRASGAKVEVATSVEAADQAIAQILSGTSALNRGLHWSGIVLAVLSLLLGSLAVWQLARRPPIVEEAPLVPTAAAPVSPLPPPIEVILDAELQGFTRPLRCRRRVRCSTDAITIAPAVNGRSPDLTLPVTHETWAICLEVAAVNPEALRVRNRGQVPVVVVDEALKPHQEKIVRLRGDAVAEIMLTQALCLQVRVSLPEEV